MLPEFELNEGDSSYLSEGKANLILRVTGNKIVRLRKASSHIPDQELLKLPKYQSYIVDRLRLEPYIDLPELRVVDSKKLAVLIQNAFKRENNLLESHTDIISPDLHIVFQQPDYTLLADICVEIKPKWPGVKVGESSCFGCCREGAHCAVNLFSGDLHRILQTISQLNYSGHKHFKIHKRPGGESRSPMPLSVIHYWIARILHRSSLFTSLRTAFTALQQDETFFDSTDHYPPLARSESEAKAITFACLADISIFLLLSFDGSIPRIRIIDLDAKLRERLPAYYDYIQSYNIVSNDFCCAPKR